MKNIKEVVFMVSYEDDNKRKHITFVKGFSAVKFLEDRFDKISFTVTEKIEDPDFD